MSSFKEFTVPSYVLPSISSLKDLAASKYALPSASIFTIVILTTLYGVYLRAFPKPLPGIPYDKEAAKSLSGDVKTLRSDPDGLAKWCSKHLSRLGSPVCQVSTALAT